MTRKLLCLVFLILSVVCMTMLVSDATAADPKAKAPAAAKPDASKIDRLPLRDRMALGMTRLDIMQAARELKAAGVPVTAEAIRDHLAEKKPQAYTAQAVNWDNILAFIEKLLPLILKLMDVFGAIDHPATWDANMLACCWFPGQRLLEARPARRILERKPLRKAGRGVLELIA